jgi:hypothetical protein
MRLKDSHLPLIVSASLAMAGAASALTIDFDNPADYDNNFYELTFPANAAWSGNNGGTLEKISGNSATVAILNTTASGGIAGSGGTGASVLNNDIFSNPTMQADFATPALAVAGDSLGFFTKVNATATSAYFAVFRMTGTGSADFRVFDTDTVNPSTGALGTTPVFAQNFTGIPAGSFATGTFYTFRLEVQDVGSNVQFTGFISTQGGAAIGNPVSFTDTTSPVLGAGQVGFRFGSSSPAITAYDNIIVVPEPASGALLGMGLLAGLLRRKRK